MKLARLVALRPARRAARPRPAASARRRARSAVVVGVLAVVAAHVAMVVAVESKRPQWRDPEFGYRFKRVTELARYAAREGRPLAVFIGSSRVEVGLSADHLGVPRVVPYNLSQSGCGPAGELVNLRRLLRAGVKPDFLAVEVLPPVLGDILRPDEVLVHSRLVWADFRDLAPHMKSPGRAKRAWALSRLAVWDTFRLSLMEQWGYGEWMTPASKKFFLWTELRPDGRMPWYTELPDADRAARRTQAMAQYQWLVSNFEFAANQDRIYRELLGLCRSHGIRTALLVMPESPAFRQIYPPGVRERIREYLAALAAEHGAALWDASEWMPDEASFSDGHHLLGRPSEAFSRRLGAECVRPWVEGR